MPTRVVSRASLREAKLQATIHERPTEATNICTSEHDATSRSDKEHNTTANLAEIAHDEEEYVIDLSAWRVTLLVYSLLTGLFLSIMDTSIVSTATYAIAEDINGGIGETTWVLLAYTLTYLGFSVIIARFSDVLGRKYTVLACFAIFISMSIGCGCAQSLHQLILFRALQGVGGAGLYALSMVVLPEITPLKLLPVISTSIGMTVAISGVLGPILGGVIAQNTTWRWIFWLNVPVAGLSAVLFFTACPPTVRGFELSKQRLSNIDYVGCMLMLGFSVMLVFGLQQAGIGAFQWSSPTVICTITFGVVSGFALIVWQFWLAKASTIDVAMIMPIRVMKDRVLLFGILSTLCTGFSHLLVLFNLPLRFQIVNLDSPKMAGIHIIPFLGAVAFGSTFGGGASAKENRTFFTFMLAATFILIGSGLLSTLGDGVTVESKNYGYQVLFGIGTGMTMSSVTLMANLQSDPRDHAVTQGIVSQARVLGGSIGVAGSTAMFNHQLLSKLAGTIPYEQLSQIQRNPHVLEELSLDQLVEVRSVFAESFNASLRLCTYVAAVGFLISIGTFQQNPPNIARRKAQIEDLVIESRAAARRQRV